MPDDELQEPLHPLDAADVSSDPPWPPLSLDEPLHSNLVDPGSLELPPEFRPTPDFPAEDDQEWVAGLDIAFSQATSLEDGPVEDISLDPLPTTIWAEQIGERPDPVPSFPLEGVFLDSLPATIWPDQTGEPAEPVLVTSAGPTGSFSLEGGQSAKGRWRLPLQRGTSQVVALVALASLALSGMYLSDRRGDDSALDFASSEPGPVIAAQGVRPPTPLSPRGSNASPPGSAPSDLLVALGVGGAVSEPAEAGAPRIGVAPRSGVFGPMAASRPAGGGAVGTSTSGAGSPTRPANPAAPAGSAPSPAPQTPAPATSPPASQSAAPVTSPPATQSGEPATSSPPTQRPTAPPPAAAPSDTSPVDTYAPDLRPTSPPAIDPPATSPPPTAPPATSPPLTSPPATFPPATFPPATSPPVTEPPATEPGEKGGANKPPGGDNPGKGHPDGKPGGPG